MSGDRLADERLSYPCHCEPQAKQPPGHLLSLRAAGEAIPCSRSWRWRRCCAPRHDCITSSSCGLLAVTFDNASSQTGGPTHREAIRETLWRASLLLAALTVLLFWMAACAPQHQIVIRIGQEERKVRYGARTVGELLAEQKIELGKLDRVEPDVWELLAPDRPVVVVRVEEKTVAEKVEIPFQRRTVRNRALAEGESRLIQPGQNGEEEVVYRLTYENGEAVQRKEVQRRVVRQAIDEIIMVGSGGPLPAVPIAGTLAYVSSGNAWIMRDSSDARRPLTSSGDLDQRVFALSPDGSQLLFTRGVAEGPPTPLNSLWVITTTVVGEEPVPLGVEGAIYAEWLPDGGSFIYSTADRIAGSPGWKARNDLHVFTMTAMTTTRSLPGLEGETYGWWGSNWAVSPAGRYVAYGAAEEIGVIDLRSGERRLLQQFPAYHTYSEWVWVPTVSWSPDGQRIAATVHGEGLSADPQDSPVFDVKVLSLDGEIDVRLAPQAGMWAMPAWSPLDKEGQSRLVYGQAREPNSSQNSLYDLYLVDVDGSNDTLLFPDRSEGLRLPLMAWSPDAEALVFVDGGDIYLFDMRSGRVHALTDDGYSGLPRWSS